MNDLSKKVSSGLIWTYAERIAAQIVTLIVTVVLARLIAPEEYGIIAIVTVFIAIADSFVISGFGNSLIQKKDTDELDYSTVFYFSIAFSFVIYFLLFICAPLISAYYEMPRLTLVIRMMGLRLPIAAVNSVQQAYVSKTMQFRRFFVSTIGGTLASAALGIILAWLGYGVWALVAQYLGNVAIGTLVLAFTSGWKPKMIYSQKRMNKLFSFGWKIMVVGVMTSLYSNLRNLVIGKRYSSDDLAYSTKGEQFPSTIAGNINSSISKVLFPALSNKQNELETLKRIMRRSISVGNYVLFPILCGLAVIAEPFVKVLLTEKWMGCIPYLRIMCVVYMLQPLQTSSLQVIKALGKGNLYLVIDIIKKVFGILVLLITVFCCDSVLAIIIGALITEIFSTVLNIPINKKLIGYTYSEQMLDIIKPASLTLLMCLGVWCISLLNIGMMLQLCLQVITGALVYLLLSYVNKDETFKYILSLLKNYIGK